MTEWTVRTCHWCGSDMPPGKRSDARFCSSRCRKASHRHPSSRLRGQPSSSRGGEPRQPWAAGAPIPSSGGRSVVALYVDPKGPYPGLLGSRNVWTKERDARRYEGPRPVIAHPPCASWSVMRGLASGRDRDCGPRAVEQVRAFGGVLEHPARSSLFGHMNIPRPGDKPDAWGGISIAVNQSSWGHKANKPTWLYFVRCTIPPMPARSGRAAGGGVLDLTAKERRLTPPCFASWLIRAATLECSRPGTASGELGGTAQPAAAEVTYAAS